MEGSAEGAGAIPGGLGGGNEGLVQSVGGERAIHGGMGRHNRWEGGEGGHNSGKGSWVDGIYRGVLGLGKV